MSRREPERTPLLGFTGNDIDHTIDRIGDPQSGARAPDDFDALDVFEHGIVHVPPNPGEQWCIDAASVQQHQQLVDPQPIPATGTHRRQLASIRAKFTPGTMRRISGRLVAPERRMSSRLST